MSETKMDVELGSAEFGGGTRIHGYQVSSWDHKMTPVWRVWLTSSGFVKILDVANKTICWLGPNCFVCGEEKVIVPVSVPAESVRSVPVNNKRK